MEKTNSQLDTAYDPKQIEQKLYDHWESQGYFKPNGDTSQESFCIMIPPPNVTGSLHMVRVPADHHGHHDSLSTHAG